VATTTTVAPTTTTVATTTTTMPLASTLGPPSPAGPARLPSRWARVACLVQEASPSCPTLCPPASSWRPRTKGTSLGAGGSSGAPAPHGAPPPCELPRGVPPSGQNS
jgi:hypothetical protein